MLFLWESQRNQFIVPNSSPQSFDVLIWMWLSKNCAFWTQAEVCLSLCQSEPARCSLFLLTSKCDDVLINVHYKLECTDSPLESEINRYRFQIPAKKIQKYLLPLISIDPSFFFVSGISASFHCPRSFSKVGDVHVRTCHYSCVRAPTEVPAYFDTLNF